jgi:hypothetical protein
MVSEAAVFFCSCSVKVPSVLFGLVLVPLVASWRYNVSPSVTQAPVVALPELVPAANKGPAGLPIRISVAEAEGALQLMLVWP